MIFKHLALNVKGISSQQILGHIQNCHSDMILFLEMSDVQARFMIVFWEYNKSVR